MKQLFIIRHGKSSWEMEYVEDIDRPLTERGIRNAYEMGKRLADRQLVPELIKSSPANRALHTAIIMARVMNIPEESILVRRNLYMPYEEEIEKTIFETPDSCSKMAIFGHNPTFTTYVNRFLRESLANLPTAGVAVITFETDSWKNISPGNVINELVDCPKKK